jgi:hypothetical protein
MKINTKINIYLERNIRMNNKFKKATEYHKHYEIHNNNKIFFNYLPGKTLDTSFPTFLAGCS